MQIIRLTTSDAIPHYCCFCGKLNVGPKGLEEKCEHLTYLGTSEGGPEYDKLKLHNESNDEKAYHEVIEELDDTYIAFYMSDPAPSALEAYIVYKL